MSSSVSNPLESDNIVLSAIRNTAEKITQLLPTIPDPVRRKFLQEFFHNYNQDTYEAVSACLTLVIGRSIKTDFPAWSGIRFNGSIKGTSHEV